MNNQPTHPLAAHYRRLLKNARAAERRASKAWETALMAHDAKKVVAAGERLDHANQVIYDLEHRIRFIDRALGRA